MSFNEAMAKAAREYLEELLTRHEGNVTPAAAEAGRHRGDLHKMLKRYGIDPKRFRSATNRRGNRGNWDVPLPCEERC